jgi:hypothetical protein
VYLIHASPLSDCPLLDVGSRTPGASDPLSSQLLLPLFLFLPSEIDEGAIVGKDFYTTFCFNSSSQELSNTHTILFKQSIKRISKRGERN